MNEALSIWLHVYLPSRVHREGEIDGDGFDGVCLHQSATFGVKIQQFWLNKLIEEFQLDLFGSSKKRNLFGHRVNIV
ncbi:hypothetical protein P8452_77015 [Trifolium repens]|nr:hypothetical protein P8452_77015 [Trifolium repens]